MIYCNDSLCQRNEVSKVKSKKYIIEYKQNNKITNNNEQWEYKK